MNGRLVRTFEATMRRRMTVFSITEGRSVGFEPGQIVTVAEDHYGNTYVDGVYVRSSSFTEGKVELEGGE